MIFLLLLLHGNCRNCCMCLFSSWCFSLIFLRRIFLILCPSLHWMSKVAFYTGRQWGSWLRCNRGEGTFCLNNLFHYNFVFRISYSHFSIIELVPLRLTLVPTLLHLSIWETSTHWPSTFTAKEPKNPEMFAGRYQKVLALFAPFANIVNLVTEQMPETVACFFFPALFETLSLFYTSGSLTSAQYLCTHQTPSL